MKKFTKIIFNEYFILSVILLLAFLVRLYKIDNPIADWHSHRQADTASVTREYVKNGFNFLYPKYHDVSSIQSGMVNLQGYRFVELPVYNTLHLGVYKLLPNLGVDLTGRLTSIFASIMSIIILFVIGKKVYNRWLGLLAAFFFAFIPYNIYYSRVVLPEPVAVMFSLASILAFVYFINSKKIWLFLSSSTLLSIAVLIKPASVFYLIPIGYLAVNKWGYKRLFIRANGIIKVLCYLGVIIVPFFVWRWWIDKRPQGVPHYYWLFNSDLIRFKPSFFKWLFIERLGKLISGVWGIFLFGLGMISVIKKNYFTHFMFLGAVIYLIVFAAGNVRHDYYQIYIIPAVSMVLAQGVVKAFDKHVFNLWLSVPVVIFSILLMLLSGIYDVKEYYNINKWEIVEAGKAVDKLVPEDALVIAPYVGDTAFLYQTNRKGWPVIDDSIEKIIERGASYYVSVNFDKDTAYVEEKYTVLEKNDRYIIVDLTKPKNTP